MTDPSSGGGGGPVVANKYLKDGPIVSQFTRIVANLCSDVEVSRELALKLLPDKKLLEKMMDCLVHNSGNKEV